MDEVPHISEKKSMARGVPEFELQGLVQDDRTFSIFVEGVQGGAVEASFVNRVEPFERA
jgi:hypothetical protein